jgi:hypothetical protein
MLTMGCMGVPSKLKADKKMIPSLHPGVNRSVQILFFAAFPLDFD